MSYTTLAQSAVDWALSKVGCAYSQAQRTQENIFDCSLRPLKLPPCSQIPPLWDEWENLAPFLPRLDISPDCINFW